MPPFCFLCLKRKCEKDQRWIGFSEPMLTIFEGADIKRRSGILANALRTTRSTLTTFHPDGVPP
jgi:hypothetical protein